MFGGCAMFEREQPEVIQALAEAQQVRDAIYEFVPPRFEAYRAQLEHDKKLEHDKRFEEGLKRMSPNGSIAVDNLKKLMARSEDVKAKVKLALLKQEIIDSKIGRLIEIDKRITAKHVEYMTSGMSAERRTAIREQILQLANDGLNEYTEIKRLEKEREDAEKAAKEAAEAAEGEGG